MVTKAAVLSLVQLLYLVFCCSGELVLYVKSNSNETACPHGTDPTVNCRLLSDYATDPFLYLSLDVNTSFVFLPGEHVLNTGWSISPSFNNVSVLKLRSALDSRAMVTCNQSGIPSLTITRLNHVEVSSLNFSSCQFSILSVEDTVFRHCRFTHSHPSSHPPSHPFLSPSILFFFGGSSIVEHCSFEENLFPPMVAMDGFVYFRRNQVMNNVDASLQIISNASATFTDNNFANNECTAVVLVTFSSLWLTGTNVFSGNYGRFSGALYCFNCTIAMDGNTTFTNNTGGIAGVMTAIFLNLSVSGNARFIGNTGNYGGALLSQNSQLYFSGDALFEGNYAPYGGAIYLVSSTTTFLDATHVTFANNFAVEGGAVFLTSGSSVNFPSRSSASVIFEGNHAVTRGGGVFIQDYNTVSYCQQYVYSSVSVFGPLQVCSFLFGDSAGLHKNLYFHDNHAQEAGSAIYGGTIGLCISNVDAYITADPFFQRTSFGNTPNFNSTSSVISSDPFILYACDENMVNCTNCSISRTVYPGATIEVTVVALGQYSGTVPATVLADYSGWETGALEDYQGIPGVCTTLSYTIYAEPGIVSLQLYANGPCLTGGFALTVEIEVIDCPPGFTLTTTGIQVACTCDPRLVEYTSSCNAENGTILYDGEFWVGFDQDSNGLILFPSCPFDFCITDEIRLNMQNIDAQCNHKRKGILCGQCSDGLSIVLGSSRCKRCSDSYLALLLFFAAAGVILVAFLLLINLTVAVGTINGLIFYANIVAANDALIFPSNSNTYLDILRVFIAWLNLDFGIESCFYGGMDTYALTWLQYAFPLYVWFLIGLVFVVSHFSTKASRILGSNPVAVLATLIMLSYTTVVRTLIEAFSAASLEYPNGKTRQVWLYDGSVPFLDVSDGRHLVLFIASLLILIFLFAPFTLLLITSQWLQIKSNWKILSWVNKPQLQAFLDAYHAPYKPHHRYWTGVLLLARLALLLASTYPKVTFLVIQCFVFLVQLWVWVVGGMYRKWYLNVLEGFFLFNLGLLAASTYQVNSEFDATELSSGEARRFQAAVTGTLVTTAIVAFLGIVAFHINLRVGYIKLPSVANRSAKEHTQPQKLVQMGDAPPTTHVTTSYITFREPLLETTG